MKNFLGTYKENAEKQCSFPAVNPMKLEGSLHFPHRFPHTDLLMALQVFDSDFSVFLRIAKTLSEKFTSMTRIHGNHSGLPASSL